MSTLSDLFFFSFSFSWFKMVKEMCPVRSQLSITARRAPWILIDQDCPLQAGQAPALDHPSWWQERKKMWFGCLSISVRIEPSLVSLHPQLLDRGPMWLVVRSPLGATGLPRIHPWLSRDIHLTFSVMHNHLLLTHCPRVCLLAPATFQATSVNSQVTYH